jgi:hypothetical protein
LIEIDKQVLRFTPGCNEKESYITILVIFKIKGLLKRKDAHIKANVGDGEKKKKTSDQLRKTGKPPGSKHI